MLEISYEDCQKTSGGSPIALFALGLAVIVAAGAIRDFTDGVFDGAGGI